MQFDKYYTHELKKSITLNETVEEYGHTSKCKEQKPFLAAHNHTYIVNSAGFGWTSHASDGYAHVHQIFDWKVVPEGDGHTHELLAPEKRGSDAVEGIDPTLVLQNPIVGSLD